MSRYQECIDWLFAQLPMFQRAGGAAYKADLHNTEALMSLLSHPERGLVCVHVGGTNGKGSVSHMLAAICQAAGYKTGLYTSPHLLDFRERIRINGEKIAPDAVVDFVETHREDFKALGLSFFEMTVGLAFKHFRDQDCDIAIIEVGMGGRLDSTNVVQPLVSVITNISFDHMQYLGNTRGAIAGEKAGIIKANTPVVISERHPETDAVFEARAAQMGAPLYFAQELISRERASIGLDLKGQYQEKNLRAVLCTVDRLEESGWSLRAHVGTALQQVQELTGLRGRWEVLAQRPFCVADTAHNEAGIEAVLAQINRHSFRQLHIVWGMVQDKDRRVILRMLPKSAIYYFCAPDIPRALPAEALKREALKFGLSGKSYPSVGAAYAEARAAVLSDDFIYVGGSTFTVAGVLED